MYYSVEISRHLGVILEAIYCLLETGCSLVEIYSTLVETYCFLVGTVQEIVQGIVQEISRSSPLIRGVHRTPVHSFPLYLHPSPSPDQHQPWVVFFHRPSLELS